MSATEPDRKQLLEELASLRARVEELESARRDEETYRREISERRAVEKQLEAKNTELARSHDLMRTIFDTAPNAMVVTEADGRIAMASRRVTDYFGIENEALHHQDIATLSERIQDRFAAPKEFLELMRKLERHPDDNAVGLSHETIFSRALRMAGAERRWVSIFSIPVSGEGALARLWIMADLTRHIVADEQIHTLVAAMPVPMIITRVRDGEVLFANEPLTSLVGIAYEDFVGSKTPDFYCDPAERDKIVAELAAKGTVHNYEVRLKRLDGTPFWALLSLVATEIGGDAAVIGGVYDIDQRHRMEDKLRDALRDLEAAHRELKQTQLQLVQSEKMASLGMLVAGIAHEINTPVGAVNSMHDTLCRALGKLKGTMEPSGRASLLLKTVDEANQVIHSGIDRVTDIVKRLRRFARLDEADLDEVDIHEGIEDTLSLIHHELKNRVTVEKAFGDLPKLHCFPRPLNQVFLNLLINASQELDREGTITITTAIEDDFIQISFTDDGPGIAPENLDRIFDPGFTTKGVGVGTGLGLSICYRIIEDHQGEISVDSEPGKGATFTIRLPTDLEARLGIKA